MWRHFVQIRLRVSLIFGSYRFYPFAKNFDFSANMNFCLLRFEHMKSSVNPVRRSQFGLISGVACSFLVTRSQKLAENEWIFGEVPTKKKKRKSKVHFKNDKVHFSQNRVERGVERSTRSPTIQHLVWNDQVDRLPVSPFSLSAFFFFHGLSSL